MGDVPNIKEYISIIILIIKRKYHRINEIRNNKLYNHGNYKEISINNNGINLELNHSLKTKPKNK